MRRFVGLVAFLIVAIAPIVAATAVPDLTWLVGGLYDGGDADEIVCLVWDETPAITAEPAAPQPSVSTQLAFAAAPRSAAPPSASSPGSRAPPLA